jgi:hypothetical protein
MQQIIRANRGRRKPRNRAERAAAAGEQLYLVRMLCGHLEEAGRVLRELWNTPGVKRRLGRQLRRTAQGRADLELLSRQLIRVLPAGIQQTFLDPIRNEWAFHYFRRVYEAALAQAGDEAELLVADSRGLSRYLVIDDFALRGMLDASGGSRETYEASVRMSVELAGALGRAVDALLLELLHVPGVQYSRREFVLTLERALARGQREAVQRGLVATRAGNSAVTD